MIMSILFPFIHKALTQCFISDTFFYFSLSNSERSESHTLITTFSQGDITTEEFCQSTADMSPLSLSPGQIQNTRGRREGGRGGERDGHEDRERKLEKENVRFDVIVCMSGFPIYGQFD